MTTNTVSCRPPTEREGNWRIPSATIGSYLYRLKVHRGYCCGSCPKDVPSIRYQSVGAEGQALPLPHERQDTRVCHFGAQHR
jgi:hypothetical protein